MPAVIYVWAEPTRIKGVSEKSWIGYAMAGDGTRVSQRTFPSIDWLKAGLGVGEANRANRVSYDELYVSTYDVVWLDAPHECAGWWEAFFFPDARYKITFCSATSVSPKLVEFRSSQVVGYVAHQAVADAWYVVPGAVTPRGVDIFPDPGYLELADAMREAHLLFMANA